MLSKIEIFGNIVSTYNISLALALIAAILIIERQMEALSIESGKREKIRILNALIFLCGLFGAAFFEVLFEHKEITINSLLTTGLTFYGGAILSVILIIIYILIFKINLLFLLNFYAAPTAIGHAIGRIGCFFAGCCFGTPTNLFWGVIFPANSEPGFFYQGIIKIHPVQLYESLSLFILFIILRKITLKERLGIYLIYYSVVRFFIEFLRADPRGSIFGYSFFSPAQIISIPMFIVGIIILVFFRPSSVFFAKNHLKIRHFLLNDK